MMMLQLFFCAMFKFKITVRFNNELFAPILCFFNVIFVVFFCVLHNAVPRFKISFLHSNCSW